MIALFFIDLHTLSRATRSKENDFLPGVNFGWAVELMNHVLWSNLSPSAQDQRFFPRIKDENEMALILVKNISS